MNKCKCLNCEKEFTLKSASNDNLGWHTTCPECGGSFDIDIENHLLQRGTKVKLLDGTIGIIDGNDAETTEEYENINYYVCPMEFYNLDAAKGYKIYKMMQERLIRRRQNKDETLKIDYILSGGIKGLTSKQTRKNFESLGNRQYQPRALKELFGV